MTTRRGQVLIATAGLAAAAITPLAAASTQAAATAQAQVGSFSEPFQEPGLPSGSTPCTAQDSRAGRCVPTAVSAAVLADGRILYWNGLEGSERSSASTTLQFGAVAASDQSRILDLARRSWAKPSPVDGGGTNPPPDLLLPGTPYTQGSSDALFCSALTQLADGRVMATGGTDYYDEPGIPGTDLGVSELQGLKNTRIFDPASGRWSQSGQMKVGRWYPSTVTLGDNSVFVASGVTKLIKPAYSDAPANSGTNVTQTETYDPKSGSWTYNGPAADHSLPLFPRLHLLPDGKVYYDAGGQTFNPDGQSYDEATWNIAAVYDPATKTWTNLDIPGIGTDYPGFKGSTFSIMLPLTSPYSSASFLSAGGVFGTTPGSYVANDASTVTTIDVSGGHDKLSTRQTGNLQNRRWYSTGVVLPDETVMAFSGAQQDGVVGPGYEIPVHQAELFNPETNTWTAMASGHRDRTYHNTAELLPDGSVLVGGHSPIPNGYGTQGSVPGGVTANNEKDPSFEIYYPPYFAAQRPTIARAPAALGYGSAVTIATSDAASISKVVLARNTSITHLVDGDQRTVELPVVGRSHSTVTVMVPTNRAVLPAGPYLLFVDKRSGSSLIPSTAVQTFVGAPPPAWARGSAAAAPAFTTRGAATSPAGRAAPQGGPTGVRAQAAPAAPAARLGDATLSGSAASGQPDRRTLGALGAAAVLTGAFAMMVWARRRPLPTRRRD
ncbi:MAG: DUF1929 domain-containing protein [Chloroflexi bacterium]|nr:MAG: DUF1929 domain-containing protein [Chloroflexota bacterium]